MQAQLIALDWGTSSLRAYKLGAGGQVLEQRALGYGIMQLPSQPREVNGQPCADGFELAFDEACGDWLRAQPGLPVIACGMVGSAQGWVQAPYCATPARVADLSAAMVPVHSVSGVTLQVVPGVVQNSALPNVMRGEETQVLGLLQGLPADSRNDALLIGLPGSHSKWVSVVEGRIVHFDTFMTGEIFAALSAHTILGRTQERSGAFDSVAFERGVQVAQSCDGDIGPLSTVFSARTLGLTGQLPGRAQPDYLSGLLIGHELRSLGEVLRARSKSTRLPEVMLIGNDQLCERYRRALQACEFPAVDVAAQATERGLWSLALAAGLVTDLTDH